MLDLLFVDKLKKSFTNVCYYVFAVGWVKPHYVSVIFFAFRWADATLIVGVVNFTSWYCIFVN